MSRPLMCEPSWSWSVMIMRWPYRSDLVSAYTCAAQQAAQQAAQSRGHDMAGQDMRPPPSDCREAYGQRRPGVIRRRARCCRLECAQACDTALRPLCRS